MTPGQIIGWAKLARQRERKEQARDLAVIALASQGEGRVIKKQIDSLLKDD